MLKQLLVFHLFILDNKVITVKGLHSTNVEPLTSLMNNSVQLTIEVNNSYQLTLTAYDDKSVAYEMLDTESSIYFQGQEFIVKQISVLMAEGFATKQVTASHIYNEVGRIHQSKVNSGEKTYSVEDVLKFYFDKNAYGYTYKVFGDFDKQIISDLGGSSGSDCLSKIIETWTGAVIYPNNREIGVYSAEAFKKNNGKRIDYLHDTSEVTLESDSTTIVNQVKASGKEKDGDKGTYYFEPFTVTDDDSVKKWGLHIGDDVSDERFTDANAMKKYVLSQMTAEPSLTITTTSMTHDQPTLGEVVRLEIRPMNLVTTVEVVSYTWNPFDETQVTSVTLNNTAKTILDYQKANKNNLKKIINEQKDNMNKLDAVSDTATTAYDSRIYGEVVGNSDY